mgnify:CR=1 FL=1
MSGLRWPDPRRGSNSGDGWPNSRTTCPCRSTATTGQTSWHRTPSATAATTTLTQPWLVAGHSRLNTVPSEVMEPCSAKRMNPTPGWSRLIKEQTPERQDLNLRPRRNCYGAESGRTVSKRAFVSRSEHTRPCSHQNRSTSGQISNPVGHVTTPSVRRTAAKVCSFRKGSTIGPSCSVKKVVKSRVAERPSA